MSQEHVWQIPMESGNIIYTEVSLSAMDSYLIYPNICITRITEGAGMWQIGSELCPIKEGDLVFLSNLEPRRITASSGNLTIAALSVSTAFLAAAGAQNCFRLYYGRSNRFTHAIHSPELLCIFDKARAEMLSDEPSRSLMLAYIIELLIHSIRAYDRIHPGALEKNFRCDATSAGTIAMSAAYINDHLDTELCVEELARLAHMSAGHYTRLFRKYVSVTPSDYIARCRIQRFLTLAQSSADNILDIALACGFTSASGFYKTFRRICGRSPLEEIAEYSRGTGRG